VIGISGRRLPIDEWVLPVAIIVIGLLVLVRGLTTRGEPARDWAAAQEDRSGTPAAEAATAAEPEEPGKDE